jgi:hypothetical protein
MARASVFLRVVVGAATLLGLGALVAVQPAVAARGHVAVAPRTATTTTWTPTSAPLPTSLPYGYSGPALSSVLNSTSCSSPSNCLAVGTVTVDENGPTSGTAILPLVETYTGGAWSASIPPLPTNAGQQNGTHLNVFGALWSVSCAGVGTCAAVGVYDATQDNDQVPLLETLSDGTWTATEGAPEDGAVGAYDVFSVSCADPSSCMAVGEVNLPTPKGSGVVMLPLVYTLASGTWQLQAEPPVPASYNGLWLNSVSCPDAAHCVVVGSYGGTGLSSYGLILTYASGQWQLQETPLPSNALTGPAMNAGGLQILDAVDCVDVGDCVAGGGYVDTKGHRDALLVTLQSGTWTPAEAPVPSDAQADPLALITGVSCPAVDACVAAGYYWLNFSAGDESGMVFTQQPNGSWIVASTSTGTSSTANVAGARTKAKGKKTVLNGVSCKSKSFCRAVGTSGKHGLIEKMGKR